MAEEAMGPGSVTRVGRGRKRERYWRPRVAGESADWNYAISVNWSVCLPHRLYCCCCCCCSCLLNGLVCWSFRFQGESLGIGLW